MPPIQRELKDSNVKSSHTKPCPVYSQGKKLKRNRRQKRKKNNKKTDYSVFTQDESFNGNATCFPFVRKSQNLEQPNGSLKILSRLKRIKQSL
jgi:hypothetical protein